MSQLKKIKSIKRYYDNLIMYDLEIEGDKSYNANHVFVHNSDFCHEHDGQIIRKSDPDFKRMNPPCHFNCRSLLIAVMIGEDKEKDSYFYNWSDKDSLRWGNGVSSEAQKPVPGFGG